MWSAGVGSESYMYMCKVHEPHMLVGKKPPDFSLTVCAFLPRHYWIWIVWQSNWLCKSIHVHCNGFVALQGIDTDEPVLQIGNYTFTGELKGEDVIFLGLTLSLQLKMAFALAECVDVIYIHCLYQASDTVSSADETLCQILDITSQTKWF